ncbi:IS3 family transposase [Orbus mooreae]|uniref:IS3 family transposase n=1 Tax=Orbus mooreae TaxID=3074107 RepID=UPI00370D4EDB
MTQHLNRKEKRSFSHEFKKQMVMLHRNGKKRADIVAEYDLTKSALDKWIKQYQETGSFTAQGNRSHEENELIALRKENKRLLMENDILKQAALIMGRKFALISQNKHRYSLRSLCRCLHVTRNQFYYQRRMVPYQQNETLCDKVSEVFDLNYRVYGTRRLQAELKRQGIALSRRRIGRIMKEKELVSKYTCKKYRIDAEKSNESIVSNALDREFEVGQKRKVLVTDLTYVRVKQRWNYLCIIVDIRNREIVGRSAGRNKTAELVMQAISQIPMDLHDVDLFHSDRGKEFDNHLIDECLTTFGITRSLSYKGCPYDNAVAEATFKAVKTEFVSNGVFDSLEQLTLQFNHYVDWFNYTRLHSTLNYQTPVEYRNR